MSNQIFLHNVALIFDAINTYSTTMTECFQSSTPLPSLKDDVLGDCVEFCQYLSERVSSLEQEYVQYQTQQEVLHKQQNDFIFASEQREKEYKTQITVLMEREEKYKNLRFSGNPATSGKSTKYTSYYDEPDGQLTALENKTTMLKTKVEILESEMDALSTQNMAQQATISSQIELIQDLSEKNAKLGIEVKKQQNDKVGLEDQVKRNKERYIQVRIDYYSVEQTNSQLRQDIAAQLIQNAEINNTIITPLKKDLIQWQQKFEQLQLEQLSSNAFIYIDPTTISIPDLSVKKSTPSILQSRHSPLQTDHTSLRSSDSHLRLLKSLQLEVKLVRFENQLLHKNLQKSAHVQQQWEHSIKSYHELYELYQEKLSKMHSAYQSIHIQFSANYQNILSLLQPLRASLVNDKKYQHRYYQLVQDNVQLRFDVQTLLFTLSQFQFHPDALTVLSQVQPISATSTSQSPNSTIKSNISQFLRQNTTSYSALSPTTPLSINPPNKLTLQQLLKVASTSQQQYKSITTSLNSISTMLKLDRIRMYSPLLFAFKLYRTLNTLVNKYQQLYTRYANLKTVEQISSQQNLTIENYRNQLTLLEETHQLTLSQLEQCRVELHTWQGQYKDEKGTVDEMSFKFNDISRKLHTAQVQSGHQRDQIAELNCNITDYQNRYNDAVEEKKHVQSILGQIYRENDTLRHLLTSNGIVYTPVEYGIDPSQYINGNIASFSSSTSSPPPSFLPQNSPNSSQSSLELQTQLEEQVKLIEKMKEYMNDYRQKAKDKLDSVLDAHRKYKDQAEQAFHTLQRRYTILCTRIEQLYQYSIDMGQNSGAVFQHLVELRTAVLN